MPVNLQIKYIQKWVWKDGKIYNQHWVVNVLCKRKVSTEFPVIHPKQLRKLRLHCISCSVDQKNLISAFV